MLEWGDEITNQSVYREESTLAAARDCWSLCTQKEVPAAFNTSATSTVQSVYVGIDGKRTF